MPKIAGNFKRPRPRQGASQKPSQTRSRFLTSAGLLRLRREADIPSYQIVDVGKRATIRELDLKRGDPIEVFGFSAAPNHSENLLGIYAGSGMLEVTHTRPSDNGDIFSTNYGNKKIDISKLNHNIIRRIRFIDRAIGKSARKKSAISYFRINGHEQSRYQ